MRNYVKGLEIVLADGSVLSLGGKLLKNNTGYDLMDLFIGSEGTLGVITKAVLKLYPRPGSSATLIIPFESEREAIEAVSVILHKDIAPLALEYVENAWVCASADHLSLKWPCEEGKAQLMLIISENSEENVYAECERINELFSGRAIYMAERREEQENILKIRSNIYTALKEHILDTLDISVPPAEIGRMIASVHSIEKEYDTVMPVYGHAADGNLHIHIMDDAEERFHELKERMYRMAHELEGVITAEHGIGKARVRDMKKFMDKKELELMKSIKRMLDPENIMNPEALFGDDA
jgi:glycolate oxidase